MGRASSQYLREGKRLNLHLQNQVFYQLRYYYDPPGRGFEFQDCTLHHFGTLKPPERRRHVPDLLVRRMRSGSARPEGGSAGFGTEFGTKPSLIRNGGPKAEYSVVVFPG